MHAQSQASSGVNLLLGQMTGQSTKVYLLLYNDCVVGHACMCMRGYVAPVHMQGAQVHTRS